MLRCSYSRTTFSEKHTHTHKHTSRQTGSHTFTPQHLGTSWNPHFSRSSEVLSALEKQNRSSLSAHTLILRHPALGRPERARHWALHPRPGLSWQTALSAEREVTGSRDLSLDEPRAGTRAKPLIRPSFFRCAVVSRGESTYLPKVSLEKKAWFVLQRWTVWWEIRKMWPQQTWNL